jgi:hypothetical protein
MGHILRDIRERNVLVLSKGLVYLGTSGEKQPRPIRFRNSGERPEELWKTRSSKRSQVNGYSEGTCVKRRLGSPWNLINIWLYDRIKMI